MKRGDVKVDIDMLTRLKSLGLIKQVKLNGKKR